MTESAAAPFEWKLVAPGDAGLAPDLDARLDQLIADKRAWNLHGVVVGRAGRLVLERYFDGPDNARGRPLGQVTFRPDTLHDLRSATKGIVGLLYGIALAAGKVPPPEAPLFASFPEYPELAAAPGRDRITVHHVLTMTMGMEWDETSLPYSDPTNSETAMDMAPDRYRFLLRSLPSRGGTGTTMAARPRCSRASSPREPAGRSPTSLGRRCSIPSASARPNGSQARMASR
jgi:CubicO group peptidase (beta-lactamase class C family)